MVFRVCSLLLELCVCSCAIQCKQKLRVHTSGNVGSAAHSRHSTPGHTDIKAREFEERKKAQEIARSAVVREEQEFRKARDELVRKIRTTKNLSKCGCVMLSCACVGSARSAMYCTVNHAVYTRVTPALVLRSGRMRERDSAVRSRV